MQCTKSRAVARWVALRSSCGERPTHWCVPDVTNRSGTLLTCRWISLDLEHDQLPSWSSRNRVGQFDPRFVTPGRRSLHRWSPPGSIELDRTGISDQSGRRPRRLQRTGPSSNVYFVASAYIEPLCLSIRSRLESKLREATTEKPFSLKMWMRFCSSNKYLCWPSMYAT